MRTIFPIMLALVAFAAAASAIGACSSTSEEAPGAPDATTDVSPADARRDAPPTENDAGAREGGRCSAVRGPCDIVLQDCPPDARGQKQDCVVSGSGKNVTTRCVAQRPSQTIPIGRACCPGADNPCLPGLACVGDPCVDGGPVTGRCTPACCEGDDEACGRSDPEGIAGACDITLFAGDVELHRVCSYRERCKPFGVEPCKAGQTCLVEDKVGTAGCIDSFDKKLGEACRFANDCADGLFCFAGSSDGGTCRYTCITPNSIHPFDASAEEAGPGRGSCPVNERCNIGPFEDRPAWLSLCTLDGG